MYLMYCINVLMVPCENSTPNDMNRFLFTFEPISAAAVSFDIHRRMNRASY
jgi:hypothetical protein